MFHSFVETVQSSLEKLKSDLDKFSNEVRFKAVRAGCVEAAKPFQESFRWVTSGHRSKDEPPVRRDRKTGQYIIRPHLADSIKTKVWRIPDGTGYYAFIGPVAIEEPHGHLLEDGTTLRYHKTGHPTGRGPALHLLRIAYAMGKVQAGQAFERGIKAKLATIAGVT